MTRGGIQVQFVRNEPYATEAKVVDPFGMRYQVPVRYENNIHLPFEELVKKETQPDWCKSHIHLLDLQGAKCVYVGGVGLQGGGIEKSDCPYQARVNDGNSFFEYWRTSQTSCVEFELSGGYWKAWARHGEYWLSSDNQTRLHWGWVYSNYSELSEEELRACDKSVIYDCGLLGGINDVKYVLAYLSSRDRHRIQREKQEKLEREAKRQEEEREQREEDKKRQQEEYAKRRAAFQEKNNRLESEVNQLGIQNDQPQPLASKVKQLWEKNLVTVNKLQDAQRENLDTAQRLSHPDTAILSREIERTKKSLADIQDKRNKFQAKKEKLDQSAQERRVQINEVKKVLEDLKAGRVPPHFSKDRYSSFLHLFNSPLKQQEQAQSGIQDQIRQLENAIDQEQASIEEDEMHAASLGQDLNQHLAQEVIRKKELQELEKQMKQTLEQRKAQLVREMGQLDATLKKIKEQNEQVPGLAREITQAWDNDQRIAEQLLIAQQYNHILGQQLSTDAQELYKKIQETENNLASIQEKKSKAKKRQEALTTSTNQRQEQIEAWSKKLAALKLACDSAKPLKDALVNELKSKDQLSQEIQVLEKALGQEKANLQQEVEEVKVLEGQLTQQVSQAASKKQELVQLEKQLVATFQKNKIKLFQELRQSGETLKTMKEQNGHLPGLAKEISQVWESSQTIAQQVQEVQEANHALAQQLQIDAAGLFKQAQETQRQLVHIQEEQSKTKKRQEALTTSTNQRQEQIEALSKKIAALQLACDSAKPVKDALANEQQAQNKLKQEVEVLEKTLGQEKASWQRELEEAQSMHRQLNVQASQAASKKQELIQLEKQLKEAFEEKRNQLSQELAQIEAELQAFNSNQGASQGMAHHISQTWEENERHAETLVDTKQKNKEAVARILSGMLGTQAMLQQQLADAQQKLQAIRQAKERAQRQKEEVATTIQEREEHIQQLRQQLVDLHKEYQSANPPREKSLEIPSKQQEKLDQELQELIDQVAKEEASLQEKQQEASRMQEQLVQEVQAEEAKLAKLEAIEKELQDRIGEGKELEEEVNEAFAQELARSIEADKETAALIEQLRQEKERLEGKNPPPHLIRELEQLIAKEEEALKASQEQKHNQRRADLQEQIQQLRDSQSKREANARRKAGVVQRLAAIDKEAFELEMNKWEEENQRRMAADMKRLEELRKEAEEDRQRAARRDQEDAANERRRREREKPWYKKLWQETKNVFGAIGDGISYAAGRVWEGVKWIGQKSWEGVKWLGKKSWEGVKWLGKKTWEGVKWLGKWIKEHPFETIIIVLALLLLAPIAIYLIGQSIAATGAGGFFLGYLQLDLD